MSDNENLTVVYPPKEKELKKKLDALMQEWPKCIASEQDRKAFCSDGFYPFYAYQKIKILFVGQESYGLGEHNYIAVFNNLYHSGFLDDNKSINMSKFHSRMFYVAYGILRNFPEWEVVPYPYACRTDIFTKDGISFAFMNISKISPEKYRPTNWSDVMRSVHEGAANIREEMKLLAPDIVITMHLMKRRRGKIASALFDKWDEVDCTDPNVHVYWATNASKKMLVLDAWHFSARNKKTFECYYQPIEQACRKYLREALKAAGSDSERLPTEN